MQLVVVTLEGYFLWRHRRRARAWPRRLIDRRHATLRLAQGEFVNVARLEDRIVAGESLLIEQIFVHGSSLRSYVVAVVVPNRDALDVPLGRIATDLTDRAADIKRLLRTEIDRVARAVGLAGHEVPRDFLVELHPFSSEAGLLTETGKMRRNFVPSTGLDSSRSVRPSRSASFARRIFPNGDRRRTGRQRDRDRARRSRRSRPLMPRKYSDAIVRERSRIDSRVLQCLPRDLEHEVDVEDRAHAPRSSVSTRKNPRRIGPVRRAAPTNRTYVRPRDPP